MTGGGEISKVISLHGDPLPSSDATNDKLVELLARLLAEAQSGQLVGMAWCASYRDNGIKAEWSHQPGQADRLSTGLMVLSRDFTEAWIK